MTFEASRTAADISGAHGLLGRLNRRGGNWEHLVKLTVHKLHCNLHCGQAMLTGEINGALGMLKIKRLMGVGGPISQTPHE